MPIARNKKNPPVDPDAIAAFGAAAELRPEPPNRRHPHQASSDRRPARLARTRRPRRHPALFVGLARRSCATGSSPTAVLSATRCRTS